MPGLAGCLDEAPSFAPRGQIPPFVLAGQVDPPLGAFYEGPIPFSLNVPFRSEDVSVDLIAQLYLDLVPGAAEAQPLVRETIEAGVFEDGSRSAAMDWVQSLEGCHTVTMILTYVDNFDVSGLPRDDARAARVVWWLNIDDVNGDAPLSSCPAANQVDQTL